MQVCVHYRKLNAVTITDAFPLPFTNIVLDVVTGHFLGQIRCHSQMLRYLADFATPLHAIVHQTPFSWIEKEDKVYMELEVMELKVMLTQTPVVQAPN